MLNGTLAYNVTPAMILTEWHRLYSTVLQFGDSLEEVVELIQGMFLNQMPHNSSTDWIGVLLNRFDITEILFEIL